MKYFISILAIFCCMQLQVEANAIQGRIISGTPAVVGQFPWQVVLKKDNTDSLLCGGSIISDSWILTAGHCTYGLPSVYLEFGTISLDDDDNVLNMTSAQLFIHPDYNSVTLNNDISLIQLPTPLDFSTLTNISPINLISSDYIGQSLVGDVATIAGFGLTDDEYTVFSQNLLWALVDIIDNSDCVKIFGTEAVVNSTICAKGDKGTNQSICSGDSGGPLIMQDSSGQWMQIGINSFVAEDQCTVGYPSGYVRITSFLPFIAQTTGLSFS